LSALASATIGTALLGISIARAKVLPPAAGFLIALGWLLSPFTALVPNALVAVLVMTIVIGYAWCGWAMWKDPVLRQSRPERR
jgi:hypothetical protein